MGTRKPRSRRPRPKRPKTIQDFFSPDGPLAAALSGYEQRPEQVEVAAAVEKAMKLCKPCLAEAGTGVGKTMAYLIPAVRAAMEGHRTIISTHTINLQNQLISRDIPLALKLVEGAEGKVSYALMKGRANYLCELALDYARTDMFLSGDPLFKKVLAWARSPKCEGDVADLPFSFSAWNELSSQPETCSGPECTHFGECHYYQMRRKAAESSIVVVNHALFFADLAGKLAGRDTSVLPEYKHVVFDEAHHLEDVATKSFGVDFTSRRLDILADRIKRVKSLDIEEERLASLQELNRRLFQPFEGAGRSEYTLDEVLHSAADAAEAAGLTRTALAELEKALNERAKQDAGLKDRAEGLAQMCEVARDELDRLFSEPSANAVRWGESSAMRGAAETRVTLHLTPIDVSALLSEALWDRIDEHEGCIVMVSATLANSGGFAYQRKRLGVPEDAIECVVGSPFDFKTQALLYVPAHLPAPAPGTEYAALLADELERLLTLTEGRAFLLFTSRNMMNTVHALLDGRLPFPVYKQGDMPPGKLVSEFRASGNGCLFGLQSFWEGVDVQGEALTCVVIDRLPFAVPDSPVTRARTQAITDAGGDWFYEYAVPQAQIRLKQGFGRLIRTRTDSGIVCILDTRILTKGYGAEFVRFLPPAGRASKWNRVERFYAGITDRAHAVTSEQDSAD